MVIRSLWKMQPQECRINSILDGKNPLIIPVGFNYQLIRYKLPLIAKDHFNELLPYSLYIPLSLVPPKGIDQ